MDDFLKKHPDMADCADTTTKYTLLNEKCEIVEQWEHNRETNKWVDVTDREKLKQEIANAQEEIEQLEKVLRLKQQCAKEQ